MNRDTLVQTAKLVSELVRHPILVDLIICDRIVHFILMRFANYISIKDLWQYKLTCTKLDLTVTDFKYLQFSLHTFKHVTRGPMNNSPMTNRSATNSPYAQLAYARQKEFIVPVTFNTFTIHISNRYLYQTFLL